jgi:hypothetical protein
MYLNYGKEKKQGMNEDFIKHYSEETGPLSAL